MWSNFHRGKRFLEKRFHPARTSWENVFRFFTSFSPQKNLRSSSARSNLCCKKSQRHRFLNRSVKSGKSVIVFHSHLFRSCSESWDIDGRPLWPTKENLLSV